MKIVSACLSEPAFSHVAYVIIDSLYTYQGELHVSSVCLVCNQDNYNHPVVKESLDVMRLKERKVKRPSAAGNQTQDT